MPKMKCEYNNCDKDATHVVTTATGKKKYYCERHARKLMRTIAELKMSQLGGD